MSSQQPPPPPAGVPAYPVQAPVRHNGYAIASMVLGILWVWWIGSILALVFGYMAKAQIEASGGQEQGMGMAIAGIVLGWVQIGILTLFLLLLVVGVTTSFFFFF